MSRNSCLWIITLVVIVTALASAVVAEPDWVSLDGSPAQRKPAATVINSDSEETTVRFTITGFSSEDIIVDGETYQSLRFPGYFTTREVGRAQIPVISEFVSVPHGATVRASIVDYKETTLSGYRINPYQRLLLEHETEQPVEVDETFYQQNRFFPQLSVEVGKVGVWRDIRMVNLTLNPVRYNPATGELKVRTEITVRLDYSQVDGAAAGNSAVRPVAREYDGMYRRGVLNYDWLNLAVEDDSRAPDVEDDGYDYLIISPSRYIKNLDDFVAWKNFQGLSTKVASLSQTGADTASIKAYIANEYFTNHIKYVLFVGNENDIPGFEIDTTANRGDTIFCDYRYSLIDGDDDFAEIAVGRFSVEKADEVDNMVRKSVLFESNPAKGDWLESVLMVAHAENAPLKYQGCKEEIRTAEFLPDAQYDVLTPIFTTAYGSMESRGGSRASNADVVAAINAGQRIVNYRGHGGDDYWSWWNVWNECFTGADVEQLDNIEMTPIVLGIACWNNNLRSEALCLGEIFTRGDDAAVAYLGASVPSYTDINHEYDKAIFDLIFDDGLNTIGNVTNEANIHLIKRYHEDALQNALSYLWLGDPSLNVIFNGDPGPAAPVTVYPQNGANLEAPAQPVLDWDEVAGATSYEVVIDDDEDFLSPLGRQADLAATDWMTPVLETGTYYWRVRAFTGEIRGAWSEVQTLNMGISRPTLYSPLDGATINNDDSVTLAWSEVSGIYNFVVQVDDDPSFGSPVVDDLSDIYHDGQYVYYLTPRLAAGTYYWRVKGVESGLAWSETWQFTIAGSVGDIVMHVADMEVEGLIDEHFHFTGLCSLSVVDQFENPVSGAFVECDWKKYRMDGTASGTTNERGIALIYTKTINDIYAPFCFITTAVSKPDVVYDPAANLVTKACESGWVYKEADAAAELPAQFRLDQNYPNPFNPSTEITLSLPSSGHVNLGIYNIKGQRVAQLVDGVLEAGNHTFTWNASGHASGVYLYRIVTENHTASRKMLLLK